MSEQVRQAFASDVVTKLLLAALTALILWFGQTVQKLTIASAVQAQAMAGIERQITTMAIDRYTGSQAKADQSSARGVVNLIDQRLTALEMAAKEIEGDLRNLEGHD